MAVVNPFKSVSVLKESSLTKAESSLKIEDVVPVPNLRINGITIYRPIIYGNVSYKLPNPSKSTRSSQDDNGDWFRWTVYVRGVDNEDLSYFIKKVVFYIHNTYNEPIRIIEKAPFELTEEGWGQFDIKIEIYFHEIPGLKPMISESIKANGRKKRKRNNHNPASTIEYNLDNDSYLNGKLNGHSNKNKKSNKNKNKSKLNGVSHNSKKRSFVEMISDDHENKNNEKEKENNKEIEDILNKVDYQNINQFYLESLNKSDQLKLVKIKSDEINNIIPTCYNKNNSNKVSVIHGLRLFGDSTEDSIKGILEEEYTEVVFKNPYYSLYEKLVLGPHRIIADHHPFHNLWKNKMAKTAQKEQKLIQTISKSHCNLLQDMESVFKKYNHLCQDITNEKK